MSDKGHHVRAQHTFGHKSHSDQRFTNPFLWISTTFQSTIYAEITTQ